MEISGHLHAPAALTAVKTSLYLFDRILCGFQSRSGRGGEEKNPAPAGNRTPVFQAHSSVNIVTEFFPIVSPVINDSSAILHDINHPDSLGVWKLDTEHKAVITIIYITPQPNGNHHCLVNHPNYGYGKGKEEQKSGE
jgi:hypothetical protein